MMTIDSAARMLSWISVMAAGIAWAGEPSRPFADALQQVDALARFRPVVKTGSFSSYDRSGGNDDGFSGKHSFLRKEGEGLVIAELQGPGVLTRIWTPTPTADPLEFYFDGETSPRLRLPFLELFGGQSPPFVAPLSGRGGGGYYCYVPLEFAKSIKVVFRGPKLQFYQINYALYESDVSARSYRPGDSFFPPAVTPTGKTIRSQHVLSPGKPVTVFETTQPGRILALKLGPAEALAGLDRRVVLRMFWDGSARPAVEVPAGDFFGASFGDPAACSLLLGTKEGWSYTNFPMPFDRSARIELVSERGSEGPDVTITSEVIWQDRPREATEGWFQAVWRRENPTRVGQPFSFLDVKGRGHLVGVTLQAQGAKPGDTGFFEGDDQATIDGELTVHGTGSEDFFNGGWYILPGRWDDRATFLLSGCLDYQLHLARTGGYRLFLADAYSFHRSLLLTIEHGPVGNQAVTDYTGVAYFYLDCADGVATPLPSVQARAVTPPKGFVIVPAWVGPIRSFSMDHATIGRVAEQVDGQTVRFLSLRQDGPPSLLQHFVALTADVPHSGRYVVSAVGIAGPDAGIVQMLRDDQPIGQPIDFYAARRGKTGLLRLAELDLTRGPNHLFFALVGKNEASTGKGFDLVEIHCQLAENGVGGSSTATIGLQGSGARQSRRRTSSFRVSSMLDLAAMNLRTSRLLKKNRAGQSATCLKMNLGDPRIVELAGLSGVDAVWLCNEHVPNDWLNLENQIRAAKLYDLDTIVRVAKGSYSDYVKPLEADATGLMVPHVTTADEARQIVQMTRFHPLGRRAWDGGNMDGKFCQVPVADYLQHSNTERVLIFQIESPEALANVEQIAAVPGFDGLLFGPGDFSHLLGRAGQIRDPDVVAARRRVAAAARAHGKFAMSAGMFESRSVLEAEGYSVFNVGADVLGLGDYFRAKVAEFGQA